MFDRISENSAAAALREPMFRRFLWSRLCSGTGVTALRATVVWHAYELWDRPVSIAIVGVVQFVPAFIFNFVGGAVADAHDRQRVTQFAQLGLVLGSVALFHLTHAEQLSLLGFYGLVFAVSVVGAFESPARSAMLPGVVSEGRFASAVTVHSVVQIFSFMTGPVIVGFLIHWIGVEAGYEIHIVLSIVSIILLHSVRPRPRVSSGAGVSIRAVVEGLRFVFGNQVVLGCMTLDMFAVIFGGAVALLPVYAKDILQVGPQGYGWLSASLEMGAVLMGIVILFFPPIRRAGRALLVGVAVFAVATIVFGLSRSFPLSLVAYAVVGMGDYVSVAMRATAIQITTPDHLRGRVSAVNMTFIGASNQLGVAESGFVAELTSPTFSVVFGGVAALVVVFVVAWLMPELRRYRRA